MPAPIVAKTGMAVGLGKGFITTKFQEAARPASRKGVRMAAGALWRTSRE